MDGEAVDILARGYSVQERLEETVHAELFVIVLSPREDGDRRLCGFGGVDRPVVVLKKSRARLEQPATAITRSDDTQHEVLIVQRLRELPPHANIVQYLGASILGDGSAQLVMEYCPRGDLFAYLVARPEARMTDHEALHVVLHLARALQYLHGHDIAHRDLALENVLLDTNGQFKICDFGFGCDANTAVTDQGFRMYYMAPELATGAPCDPKKADMWSLGIVLYVMLTGSPLLELASSDSKEFRAIRDIGCRGLVRLWGFEHLFTESTMDLLTRLLQVDPALRYESAAQILAHPAVVDAAHREARMNELI